MSSSDRSLMNGKPVLTRPARTIINMKSGFAEKLLCDGPTFSLGDACAYSCTFCYVPSMMQKAGYMPKGQRHESIVVRRENALLVLDAQLKSIKQTEREKPLVIYSSPLVDCAANMDLVRETAQACTQILLRTEWHIRLLSKSNLLPKLAKLLLETDRSPDWHRLVRSRMIFGVSTGTLDDAQSAAFEKGCPKPSKRIQSLHQLQDEGWRTFGMVCPSLPQQDYVAWAQEIHEALRPHYLEHIWAEVINARGASLTHTVSALHHAGYEWQASALQRVSQDPTAWEDYARQTFRAHAHTLYCMDQTRFHQQPRLRFLQYVTSNTRWWWEENTNHGAVLLGAAAH